MYPESSVWLIIILAFIFATLPFLTERMFAFVPAQLAGEPERFGGYYQLRAILSYAAIALAAYLMSMPLHSVPLKAVGFVLFILVLALPSVMVGPYVHVKKLAVRLFELLALYFLAGSIGFMVESYYANSVPQQWQFYAISLSIFVVLAFPGFVWRHLMKHPQNRGMLKE